MKLVFGWSDRPVEERLAGTVSVAGLLLIVLLSWFNYQKSMASPKVGLRHHNDQQIIAWKAYWSRTSPRGVVVRDMVRWLNATEGVVRLNRQVGGLVPATISLNPENLTAEGRFQAYVLFEFHTVSGSFPPVVEATPKPWVVARLNKD